MKRASGSPRRCNIGQHGIGRACPPVRAMQVSGHQARDARRGSRAGLAPDPIRVPRATVRAAGLRLQEQRDGWALDPPVPMHKRQAVVDHA
jgi:hypothetical protein